MGTYSVEIDGHNYYDYKMNEKETKVLEKLKEKFRGLNNKYHIDTDHLIGSYGIKCGGIKLVYSTQNGYIFMEETDRGNCHELYAYPTFDEKMAMLLLIWHLTVRKSKNKFSLILNDLGHEYTSIWENRQKYK